MEIYSPAEDSYFFADFLKDYLSGKNGLRFLDMGCGSGILMDVASEYLGMENVFGADVNLDAVEKLRRRGYIVFHSDLFEVVEGKFDLIVFNAPYLPADEGVEDVALYGGKEGDEIVLRFFENVGNFLNDGGKVYVLVSSHTPLKRMKGFGFRVVARKRIFFEELLILEFSKENFAVSKAL